MNKITENLEGPIDKLKKLKKKLEIVGSFFRIDKKINDDFTRNCKDSEIERKPGQSKRDVIMQELMKGYNEKGDKMLNINSI